MVLGLYNSKSSVKIVEVEPHMICLRSFNQKDASNLAGIFLQSRLSMAGLPRVDHPKVVRRWICKANSSPYLRVHAVCFEFRPQDVIAGISLQLKPGFFNVWEIGFWVHERWQRLGVASLAVEMALKDLQSQHKVCAVYAKTQRQNIPSISFLEKMGFCLDLEKTRSSRASLFFQKSFN